MARKEDDEIHGGQDDDPGVTSPAEFAPAPEHNSSANVAPGGVPARRERSVGGRREGFISRAGTFLHDVRSELRRVNWPSAKDVQKTTVITIIAVIFFALYLWGVDHVLTLLVVGLERLVGYVFG